MCGGTKIPKAVGRIKQGLSPRVRGNRSIGKACMMALRSIPACAGEPAWLMNMNDYREVYPRVCGGTSSPKKDGSGSDGLSPRVRGNHGQGQQGQQDDGSIPACAGEPGRAAPAPRWPRVYPRVCGGTGWNSSLLQKG